MSIIATLTAGYLLVQLPASTLVASDTIRAGERITQSNSETHDGFFSVEDEELIGREVRRTVYAGKPIKPNNTQAPRLVKRNQIVTVKYVNSALQITMSGRAMGEAGEGDTVSVMNTQSRKLIHGTVTSEGWILAQ